MKSQKIIPSNWDRIFWLLQQGDLPSNEDRFCYKNFSKQPIWLIRQALSTSQQKRNLEHLTQARSLQAFINSKIDPKKGKPIKDESSLLPHPDVWKEFTESKDLSINQSTAKEIVEAFENWLDSSHKAMLDEYINEIKRIASN